MFVDLNVGGITLSGMINASVNVDKEETEVFIDDRLLITYALCTDVKEAVDMTLEIFKAR